MNFTYPGVYINEVPGAPSPIAAASPSTGSLIGGAIMGPVDTPTLVTSFTDFVRKFGGFTSNSIMPTSAFAFFENGGQRLQIVRVAANDATNATGYLGVEVTSEALTADAGTLSPVFATFTGPNATNNTPIARNTVSILVTSGGVAFTGFPLTDNGNGVLSNTQVGVSGTIDYETGEITISGPAGSTLNTATFAITYEYMTFGFESRWPGDAANDIGVIVSGDANYFDQTIAEYSRFIVQTANSTGVLESYAGISFTDPTDARFIATVLNDGTNGSQYVSCTSYGNNVAPAELQGVSVTGEALTPSPAFNGTVRSFAFTPANPVTPGTFSAAVALTALNTGASLQGDSASVAVGGKTLTCNIQLDTLALVLQDIAASRVTQSAIVAALNGLVLKVSAAPNFAVPVYATTTLTWNGTAFVASSGIAADSVLSSSLAFVGSDLVATITLVAAPGVTDPDPRFNNDGATQPLLALSAYSTFSYALGTLTVTDDGEGALSASPVNGLGLDAAGVNTIAYGPVSPSATMTFRFNENPARGPSTGTVTASYYAVAQDTQSIADLSGGFDGSALTRSVVSAPALALDGRGLYSLSQVEDILSVSIPDFETDTLVSGDLINYCDSRLDRFFVISVPAGLTRDQAVSYRRSLATNSSRGAIFYPHVRIIDPLTENEVLHPFGGHAMGIFARTDVEANVATAPAGRDRGVIRFATGLEYSLTSEDVGVLNPASVNCLVQFSFTGRVLYGARTMQISGEYPYIQQRRTMMFVQKSIFNGAQQFVFENNGPALRARVRLAVSTLLLTLYNAAYFAGNTPQDAFVVICDESNNPQTLVDQGILTCDVGIALFAPAEFIFFRFQRKALV